MPRHLHASHRIAVEASVDQAFLYFTPAGEELWVDGWQPNYLNPPDGRTQAGMVFTTGQGDDRTIWTMVDFDRLAHHARYVRCTPASRTGTVDVRCTAAGADRTEVQVSYTLTALTDAGERVLEAFEGDRFATMIDGWAREIAARRDVLLKAVIR